MTAIKFLTSLCLVRFGYSNDIALHQTLSLGTFGFRETKQLIKNIDLTLMFSDSPEFGKIQILEYQDLSQNMGWKLSVNETSFLELQFHELINGQEKQITYCSRCHFKEKNSKFHHFHADLTPFAVYV